MSRTRVSIPFSQRGPIPIHLEDSYTGSPTGCSVIDVIFPQGEEISEVRFKSVLWHHLCGVVFSNLDNINIHNIQRRHLLDPFPCLNMHRLSI